MDARVDAYVPAAYIGSEALKIDLHRRLALVEDEDELRELRASVEDRYGELPDPVENLFAIQEAKLKVARAGAEYLVFRGGRLTVGPLILGSGELRELRERIATAVYTAGKHEVALRSTEFRESLGLVEAILEAQTGGVRRAYCAAARGPRCSRGCGNEAGVPPSAIAVVGGRHDLAGGLRRADRPGSPELRGGRAPVPGAGNPRVRAT